MAENKRFYWIKLKDGFFREREIKKMRRLEKGGDYIVIYQKLMLLAMNSEGYLVYEGVEESMLEQLALELDEDQVLIEETIDFCIKNLLLTIDGDLYLFNRTLELTGSESESTERVRKHRKIKAALQCNATVTDGNEQVIKCNTEKETNTETEPDIHLKSDKRKTLDAISKTEQEQVCADADSVDRLSVSAAADAEPPTGDLFSVAKLNDIVAKNKINLTDEGVKIFHEEMQESGWTLYKKPVEKKFIIKVLREWSKKHVEFHKDSGEGSSGVQKGKKTTQKPVNNIESGIWEIAKEYISQRLFDENPGGHKLLIYRFCPKNAFDQDQLDHMASWGVYPKHQDYVEVDEYLEDE